MYKLSELKYSSFTGDHPVALDNGQTINWSQFVADVNANRGRVNADSWALFHTDTYTFATGLIALLAENATIYLPGDSHTAVTSDFQAQQVKLIGEFPCADCQDIITGTEPGTANDFSLGGNIVVYTSGSTGKAKAITKTLAQMDRELLALESLWGKSWNNPVIAGTVSHQHLYGLLFSLLWPLCSGRLFCRKPFIDPAIMAGSIQEHRQAVWVMSPAHLHRMPPNMPWDNTHGKVQAVFSSGGPLQQTAAQNLYDHLGQYPIEVLGSSETGGIASREQVEPNSPWQPFPEVNTGVNEQGTLTVRSPWLEDKDWYATADLATLCDDGTFQLGMRADRIVKLEGKRVALPEVESALTEHPWINEAATVIVSRQRQSLGAVLVLTDAGRIANDKKGRHGFTKELRQYLRQHVSSAAIPRFWRITPALPKNSQGKVIEKTARDLFKPPTLPAVLNCETEGDSCLLELQVNPDNPYFQGHFPDEPILAGVVQLLWAQHFGREYLRVAGKFSGMKTIKFRQLVFPGRGLRLSLEYIQKSGRLKFHYQSNDGHHSQGILLYEAGA
jgi:hypothetical protein